MKPAIITALAPVRDGAASIESAFLGAGEGLGRGLDSFDAIGRRLEALTTELSETAMADAMHSLGQVASALRSMSESLPVDKATLAELVDCNRTVESSLQGLMDKMRMMFTLARAARIEAATVDRSGKDFVNFTVEIMELTRSVQDDLALCGRGQDQLSSLLLDALRSQSALDHEYRQQLVDLAGELDGAIDTLGTRRDTGIGAMQQLSARSHRMRDAVRTAIMSLQGGDATRQRLEHIHHGLGQAEGLDDDPGNLDGAATVAAMAHLLSAQLGDAVASFQQDAGQIDGAFAVLLRDTHELVHLGRQSYREGGDGHNNVLDLVQQRVARAGHHIGTCETARAVVDGTIASLQERLTDLGGAVSRLSGVIGDIVLIGLNAGLRAGRLGNEGRGLVVIAQELKGLAAGVGDDASSLLAQISTMRDIALRLDRCESEGRDAGALERDTDTVIKGLRAGGERVGDVLAEVDRGGSIFEADLSAARASFSKAAEFAVMLGAIADELGEVVAGSGHDLSAGRDFADATMQPCYTMAREREVHDTAFSREGDGRYRIAPTRTRGREDMSGRARALRTVLDPRTSCGA